ncbi:MAG: DUF1156 domain-containing protein, partial [Candidatus Hydrogenedentota bacterium]
AEKRIGHLYPKVKVTEAMAKDRPDLERYVGRELTVIAWLWARTVASPNPAAQGEHVPLATSFWLSKKKGKEAYVLPVVDQATGTYHFEVHAGKPAGDTAKVVDSGTKLGRRCNFRCLFSEMPMSEEHVKTEARQGRTSARLMAIVCEGERGRVYLSPTTEQEEAANTGRPEDLDGVEAPLANDPRNLWCLGYGLDTFDKLFTARQLVALTTFSDLVGEARERVRQDAEAANDRDPDAYADAVATYLAFTVSRQANRACTICFWDQTRENLQQAFGRQALPMTWDFAESNPLSDSSGNWLGQLHFPAKCVDVAYADTPGNAVQRDAVQSINGLHSPVISTDPPYYDNIGYADLSDFFYVWLRRSLGSSKSYKDVFSTLLTPKSTELIASPYRHDGNKQAARDFFEEGLGKVIGKMRESGHEAIPVTIFYAFKQSESDVLGDASTGWETFLEGIIHHRYAITGTWPVRTELIGNLKNAVNALASSIILSCRPRPEDAPMATRKEFAEALRRELPGAIREMQSGNIAPVDLAQASIGPGMAVFSRYNKVLNADGTLMTVREALALINQVLDETLSEQEYDFDAWTRWALKWHEQYCMDEGPFGDAETLAKAMAVSVEGLVEAGILKSAAGKVRLVRRDELDPAWDPQSDKRLTIWEVTQHLVRNLEADGEPGAAALLKRVGGGAGETARELAYRLYQTCERKKWAKEAGAYNGLVVAWPEIVKLSREQAGEPGPAQEDLF